MLKVPDHTHNLERTLQTRKKLFHTTRSGWDESAFDNLVNRWMKSRWNVVCENLWEIQKSQSQKHLTFPTHTFQNAKVPHFGLLLDRSLNNCKALLWDENAIFCASLKYHDPFIKALKYSIIKLCRKSMRIFDCIALNSSHVCMIIFKEWIATVFPWILYAFYESMKLQVRFTIKCKFCKDF